MTSEEIIRLARSVGIHRFKVKYLARFVDAIAAAERERLKWDGIHSCHPECDRPTCVHTRKAVEEEREACAKICDETNNWPIAHAIRARGKK